MRAKRLDNAAVAKLKAKAKRQTIPDPELRGHYIRITPTGSKSFWVVTRDPSGKQIWRMIGDADKMSIEAAREQAGRLIRTIRVTVMNASSTFESVAREWFERQVVKRELRTERQIRRLLEVHVFPALKGRPFDEVRRKEISALLDAVEHRSGTHQADVVLGIIRSVCTWYALRDDNYNSPIVRGMERAQKTKRARVLNDQELTTLWQQDGSFGNFTKLMLLTAQRRDKFYTMRWTDICDGVWNIRTEPREKGNGGDLVLPQVALDVLEDQRRINGDSLFVFAHAKGGNANSRIQRLKGKFASEHQWPQWQLHDLRRSARSLMAAAGVPVQHAERVLGHVQPGVLGTYDRHAYLEEKGQALLRLASKIRDIVTPPPANVHKLSNAS
jgi:integrase